MDRHSPDSGEFGARIAPPNRLGNGKSPRRGEVGILNRLDQRQSGIIFAEVRILPRPKLRKIRKWASPKRRAFPHIIQLVNEVVRTSRQMLPEIGREPTAEDLADKLAMPLDKLRRVLAIANRPIRLETESESG